MHVNRECMCERARMKYDLYSPSYIFLPLLFLPSTENVHIDSDQDSSTAPCDPESVYESKSAKGVSLPV